MGDIQWGKINVTIEKVDDPSVLNVVLEHYDKAKEATGLAGRFFTDLCEMRNELYGLGIIWGTTATRRVSNIKELIDKWEESNGEKYDMIFEKYKMLHKDALVHCENAKRILNETGVRNNNTIALEKQITETILYCNHTLKDYEKFFGKEYLVSKMLRGEV